MFTRAASVLPLCVSILAVVPLAGRSPATTHPPHVAAQASVPDTGLPVAAPDRVGLDSAVLAELTTVLRAAVTEGRAAGVVAMVARHGVVGYLQAEGVQDLSTGTPMSPASIFRIYSMTKAVTAVAVMQLQEQGRFRLSDPVATYLPEFGAVRVVSSGSDEARPPARPVTIEDLLLHTAGLSHRTSDLYRTLGVRSREDTLPTFVRRIAAAPLLEDPGTRFRYSEATTVLGRLVEVWSGQPFDVYLRTHVFDPLRMNDTGFVVPAASQARLTTVYRPDTRGALQPVELETPPFTERPALLEGSVGLVSTVPDFARFAQMLLGGGTLGGRRVLRADTVRRITANGLPKGLTRAGGQQGWGLANVSVLLADSAGPMPGRAGEYGWDGTADTIFWSDPSTGTLAQLFLQRSPANPDRLREQVKALVHRAIRP